MIQVESDVKKSHFFLEAMRNASRYDWRGFRNDTVRRMFWKITDVGPSALSDPEKIKRVMCTYVHTVIYYNE